MLIISFVYEICCVVSVFNVNLVWLRVFRFVVIIIKVVVVMLMVILCSVMFGLVSLISSLFVFLMRVNCLGWFRFVISCMI